MGNENSHLSGLEIEETPTEVTDFWSHYRATVTDSCRYFNLKSDGAVSVLKGEAVLGPLWTISSPLEKYSNNLLKFRHPCIVRYLSSWQQRSTLHLATEFVQPLSQVLDYQTPLQICIGLNNILRALVFLQDQAGMSHNNVSITAIYVTGDGQWKLGGLQYLCPFIEITQGYLKQCRLHRYDKAIDPNEDAYELITKIDQYSFAVLVEDVFIKASNVDVPYLEEFKNYCKAHLQNSDPRKRPNLSEVLQHDFFNHEFITIYKFLNFLPLKSEEEKHQFFSNILDHLKCYDEETVAKQLSGLLLSRLTMLDHTARKDVVPFILKPKNDRIHNSENSGFFSLPIFKEHVKPRLIQLFSVRDSQIRMLLLIHFSNFVNVFTHEELSQNILPELLLGIKDTDDSLVASTLVCLSELVPILGADTVVGGKRSKLFVDGRPNSKINEVASNISQEKSLKEFSCSEEIFQSNHNHFIDFNKEITLNERPSPVGGESIETEILPLQKIKELESEEDWSDWDSNKLSPQVELVAENSYNTEETFLEINDSSNLYIETPIIKKSNNSKLHEASLEAKKNILDITELDIKNQKTETSKRSDEFDFFADMEPVLEKPSVVTLSIESETTGINSKLNFVPNTTDGDGEWGESWDD